MPATIKATPKAPLRVRLIDAMLLIVSIILAINAFLTMEDPILNIGAVWIVKNIEGAIHQANHLSALYNVWVFLIGGITLVFIIGSIEYYPKRLGEDKIRRRLLITCTISSILIFINLVITSITA
jgi:hypothetical protein